MYVYELYNRTATAAAEWTVDKTVLAFINDSNITTILDVRHFATILAVLTPFRDIFLQTADYLIADGLLRTCEHYLWRTHLTPARGALALQLARVYCLQVPAASPAPLASCICLQNLEREAYDYLRYNAHQWYDNDATLGLLELDDLKMVRRLRLHF